MLSHLSKNDILITEMELKHLKDVLLTFEGTPGIEQINPIVDAISASVERLSQRIIGSSIQHIETIDPVPNFFFHPTKVVFVDDHQGFLDTLKRSLNFKDSMMTTDIQSGHQEILKDHLNVDDLVLSHVQNGLLDGAHTSGVTLKLNKLKELTYQAARFSRVSVIISDYDMPTENGIQFLSRFQHLPVAKILMTAEAEDEIAINAFEKRLIDGFIPKQSKNFIHDLEALIQTAKNRFFERAASNFNEFLPFRMKALFQKKQYQEAFSQVLKASCAVEYYLVDESGSFLFLDEFGNPTWLVVRSEEDFQKMEEIIEIGFGPQGLLKFPKGEREKLFFLIADEDIPETLQALENHRYPAAELLPGIYYAIISARTKNRFEWSKLKPYCAII